MSASSDVAGGASLAANMMLKEKDYQSVHDRESLFKARSQFGDLKGLIESLSEKLSVVSSVQEKEFLNAYRVHMLNVQLELRELKQKVLKAEEALRDDAEIAKLQQECNWFHSEATRLQGNKNNMGRDIMMLRSRLQSLDDQQVFLKDQLKVVLKKTRVIEAELELNGYIDKGGDNFDDDTRRDGGGSVGSHSRFESQPYDHPPSRSRGAQNSGGGGGSRGGQHQHKPTSGKTQSLPDIQSRGATDRGSGKRGRSKGRNRNHRAVPHDNFVAPAMSPKRGAVVKLRTVMSEKTLSKTHPVVPSPERQLHQLQKARTQDEIDLEQLIKQRFSDIVKRRAQTAQTDSRQKMLTVTVSSSKGGGLTIRDAEASKAPRDVLVAKEVDGMCGLGVEYFTESDRLAVVESYLSNFDNFEKVIFRLMEIGGK